MKIIVSFLVMMCSSIVVAAENPTCKKYSDEMDFNDRRIASVWQDGTGDNSAPRATNRLLQESIYTAQNSIYLTALIQSKCQIPAEINNPGRYLTISMYCWLQKSKGINNPECDIRKWTANYIPKPETKAPPPQDIKSLREEMR